MNNIPDFRDFRKYVDSLGKGRNATLIKTLYLTASRANEILTKCSKSDHTTQALGHLGTYQIVRLRRFKGADPEPILLLKLPVSKRKSRKNVQVYKMIALPCHPDFEPWTLDLLKWIRKRKSLCFDLTRQAVYRIICNALKPLDPHAKPHSLRHYRLTHLAVHYDFQGHELAQIAGWTTRTGMGFGTNHWTTI